MIDDDCVCDIDPFQCAVLHVGEAAGLLDAPIEGQLTIDDELGGSSE